MAITPIGSILDIGNTIIDRVWPSSEDKAKRDEAKAKLLDAQSKGELSEIENRFKIAMAQIDVNKTEAQSENWFIAGGRPAIIWICALAFSWNYFLQPLLSFILVACNVISPDQDMPIADMSEMLPILGTLLGLGGMHVYERSKGVSGNKPTKG